MIPIGVSKKLRDDGSARLILATNPTRRVTSFLLFAVLLAAMIVGVDPQTDFSGRQLIGTAFFLCLMGATLLSALYSWALICDRSTKTVAVRRVLLTFTLWHRSYSFSAIGKVLLKKVMLVRGTESGGREDGQEVRPTRTPFDIRSRPDVRRRQLASLHLVLEDQTLLLDSSTDSATLEAYGRRFAEFLEVPLDREP